jgi:hypothetical protein
MKLTCPNCGSENGIDEALTGDARGRACASCGAGLPANARRAGVYDGYAVGRRVLRVVPAWLLILVASFVVVLLLFKWAARPVGNAGGARADDFNNEATNRPPPAQPSPPDSHAGPEHADRAREETASGPRGGEAEGDSRAAADSEGERQGVSGAEEAASFSVQAGAFDDRRRSNSSRGCGPRASARASWRPTGRSASAFRFAAASSGRAERPRASPRNSAPKASPPKPSS